MAGNNNKVTTTETEAVRAAFPERCRVMSVGDSHVFTVQPADMDVTIKFKLPSAYPSVIPEITIRSESLTEEDIDHIEQILREKAASLLGQDMILTLTSEAEDKFRARGLRPGKTRVGAKKPAHKKKNKKRKPKSEDEVDENEKLPSMKTSDDVVKRIIWDESLEKDDFIVGYIDRFRGLVEKYFSAFSWEDLASVDYDVLAVPKHRIQYFSYKGVKVWDKLKRLDNVFGSAKGTKTIDKVIEEMKLKESQNGTHSEEEQKSVHLQDEDEDSDSSDYDDGIVVTIGGSNQNAEAAAEGDQKYYDPYWKDKLRPNYFLCVRITDDRIIDQVTDIQDHLMQEEPLFGECCIPGAALHVTLCTVRLDDPFQIRACGLALTKAKSLLQSALPKSTLKLEGVSDFHNRVLYAKVHYEQDFLDFHTQLKEVLSQAGVQIADGFEFVPHVTIMKTTRPVSRIRGTKSIDPKMYEQFLDTDFGHQKVDAVYLCAMGNERQLDGFYLTSADIDFKQ